MLLGHDTEKGFTVTGLAVLLLDPCRPFTFPGTTAAAVSKALVDTGDLSAVFTVR